MEGDAGRWQDNDFTIGGLGRGVFCFHSLDSYLDCHQTEGRSAFPASP